MRNHLSTAILAAALALSSNVPAASWSDKLTSGEASQKGPALVAGSHGVRYELRGGARVELSEGSEFTFAPSLHLKLRGPSDPATITRVIQLLHGRAEVDVPALREPTAVMIRGAGRLSAVAKGGHLTFVADSDRTTAAARQGEMLVGVGNEWKPLHQGLARTLAPNDPSALPRPILGAPRLSSQSSLSLIRTNEAARAAVSWARVENAARYDVTVRREGVNAAVVSHQVVDAPTASVSALSPGSYAVVVAAVDRQGLAGEGSKPCPIRVVGVEAPEGSVTTDDGALVIGRDQHVTLVGADGLEMSYGASALFMGAPSTLGLAHGESTTVRLRVPGTSSEAVLHMEPKGLHAAVRIGPRTARWPLDHVAIEINLYDTSGRPIPDESALDTSVTINLTKVAVKWTRSGHKLRGTVPTGPAPGPWVVRAEVRDRNGDLLGRDFLEVARVDEGPGPVAAR